MSQRNRVCPNPQRCTGAVTHRPGTVCLALRGGSNATKASTKSAPALAQTAPQAPAGESISDLNDKVEVASIKRDDANVHVLRMIANSDFSNMKAEDVKAIMVDAQQKHALAVAELKEVRKQLNKAVSDEVEQMGDN